MAKTTPLTRDEFAAYVRLPDDPAFDYAPGPMDSAGCCQLFEIAANSWLAKLDLAPMPQETRMAPSADASCTIFSNMTADNKIVAGLRIAHLENASVRYQIALFRDDDETASAQGFFTHVCEYKATGEPAPLPRTWYLALEDYLR
jgi:acyl-CoA thioester hydrolase